MKSRIIISCFIAVSLLTTLAARAADIDVARGQPSAYAKDSLITSKIKAKLAEEKLSSLVDIKVDTDNDGAVVLSGNVRTQEEATRAMEVARTTEDVKSVTSHIKIRQEY